MMLKLVEYDYYTGTYGGDMIENDFNRAVVKASAFIAKVTFDRVLLTMDEETEERVKWACCEMCDRIQAVNATMVDGAPVKSVSNDGYSVSYVTEADGSANSTETKMYDLAKMYLPDELLYKGVC